MLAAGIDAGSRAVKAAIVEAATLKLLATAIADQGVDQEAIAGAVFDEALDGAGASRRDVVRAVATGYGRDAVGVAAVTVTEITCHARGVFHAAPGARTVIDIGGQDSKLMRLNGDGRVRDFSMNDRCAAGTGRFLEVVAARLGVGLHELGGLAARSANPAAISSMCVVFAETEIIGLLAGGAPREDIAAGVQSAIATRVASMAGRRIEEPVVFTGGVALVPGMREALGVALGREVSVAGRPQFTGALGAALLAAGGCV
ncbi:MAG: 2-hydroxyglutaryl-CoA dehydratase [Lentisphaerae bacterium]|nr:2-hydroxyglutaryl-CoA dehydratase [Lentisphaerota bacterium]